MADEPRDYRSAVGTLLERHRRDSERLTGGPILGAALFRMNVGGRIACCGVVSQYDTDTPEPGPRGVPGLLVNKGLTMRGFLVFEFGKRFAQEGIDVALDPLGAHPGIGHEGVAGAAGIAFGFRVEHLVGQITDLFAQALKAVTEPAPELASFFGGQQQS